MNCLHYNSLKRSFYVLSNFVLNEALVGTKKNLLLCIFRFNAAAVMFLLPLYQKTIFIVAAVAAAAAAAAPAALVVVASRAFL